jgi:DNA-binding NtrC family response regulator
MNQATALLLSRDPSLVEACQGVVRPISNLCLEVLPSLRDAEAALQREEVALLLVHLVQANETREVDRLLRRLASLQRPVATLVVLEQHDAKQTLTLLRQGVAECLSRPLDLNRLAYLLDALTVRRRYAPLPPAPLQPAGVPEPLLGMESTALECLLEQVRVVAPQQTTLLLGGETGTGKTRLARLIHELSPRRKEPFLVVNCGALAPHLIESELFGHMKGAFTGAERDRSGKFTDAGSGTLVLDEIDALPLTLQAKLLRAVEERVFEPVGSNKSQVVRARLIAASNRVLEKEVEAGRFRSDLYYRLNVVAFHLPPLRERRAAIRPLATQFLAEFAARNRRPVSGIAEDAFRVLQAYHWPGNIRELRNVIERAVALCPRAAIQLDDLPEAVRRADAPPCFPCVSPEREAEDSATVATLDRTRETAEATRIDAALKKHRNNRLRAAAELGISRMTLYNKLHKYGMMDRPPGRRDTAAHEVCTAVA